MKRFLFLLGGVSLILFGLQGFVYAQIHPQEQPESLLATYPGFGHNAAVDEARYNQEELARQHLIAECMQQQGFTYTPAPARTIEKATTPEQDYAASQDPNLIYADSLNVEQRQAYYLALYGVSDPYDPTGPVGGGCSGEASRTIPGVYAAQSKFTEQLLELEQSVREDSWVTAAEQRWSACMKDRGYTYATTMDLLSEGDRATGEGQLTPAFEQYHQQAVEVAKICDAQVGLEKTITQVRIEQEAVFVAAQKVHLEQHLEHLRNQEALVNQLLNDQP